MQMKDAKKLRDKWGNRKCDHPDFDREYDLGGSTGDYNCTQCGQSFMKCDVDKIKEDRRNK